MKRSHRIVLKNNFQLALCIILICLSLVRSLSISLNNKQSQQNINTNKKSSNIMAPLSPEGVLSTSFNESTDDDDDDDDKTNDEYESNEFSSSGSEQSISSNIQPGELDDIQKNELPFFLKEPDNEFIGKKKPAKLKCITEHALKLVFKCSSGTPPTMLESHVNPQTGHMQLEATAIITKDIFETYFGGKFHCYCEAWNPRGDAKSRYAYVELAKLDKNFILSPPSAHLEPGYTLELKCTLPDAHPRPTQSWQKNGQDLISSSSMIISDEGTLLIHSVKVSDSGNYTCVAENIVGKKISDPLPVVIRSEKRWSEWTLCGKDCRKTRWRNCKPRSYDECQGKDLETVECNDGSCELKHHSQSAQERSDRIVYFSLIIVSILCVILAVLFAHSKRKKPEIPDYIVTDDEILEIQPKTNSFEGEKRYRQQLESTKKSSYSYEYNTMSPDAYNHQHHQLPPSAHSMYPIKRPMPLNNINIHDNNIYHEPHVPITYSVPFDKISKVSNSNTSSTKKLQSDTISSSNESLNSTQVIEIESSSTTSLLNNTDKNLPKSNMIEQMVTSNGGWLELEHLETSLSIPEYTFERTRQYNIFLTVLHNEFIKNQILTCNFNENSLTHLSSIIYCGPADVLLNKPIILKFPHCANNFENWNISLLHNSCANDSQKTYIEMDDEKDKWKRIASTANDVVNPAAFIQLDNKYAFIISRVFGKLLLVGESRNPLELDVEKRMKIAIFGPKHKMPASDFNVRVYIVEDYRSSIDYCTIIEKNLGNDLLMLSKDFLFKSNKEDLWVQLVCSGGWQTRNESQKIPFSHLWKNSFLLHCDFLLERNNSTVNKLNMEIFVKQKHGDDIFLNNLLLYT